MITMITLPTIPHLICLLSFSSTALVLSSCPLSVQTLTVPEMVRASTTSSVLFLGRSTWKAEIQSGPILELSWKRISRVNGSSTVTSS